MSLPAMSFGDRFCMSGKGGTGEGGQVHPKGYKQHSHVWAQLLVGTGISVLKFTYKCTMLA